MARINWHRHHKWSGIASAFMLLVFCISGILLNHRSYIDDIEISRKWLPWWYEFRKWNGGLMRGTIPYKDKILIFGINGIWLTDSTASRITEFNRGLPAKADGRQVRNITVCDEIYYAATATDLYRLTDGVWSQLPFPNENHERLSDITSKDDTLVAVGRSSLYMSTGGRDTFSKIDIAPAEGMDGKVTLFKTIWMLHCGELFGMTGKIIVDLIALTLVVLSATGLIYWLLPKAIRHRKKNRRGMGLAAQTVRTNLMLHNRIGKITVFFTLLIAVTGWCLRPPVMIPLVLGKVPAIPGTNLDSPTPWYDRLRMLRYDDLTDEWLLSTSDGFYSLNSLSAPPHKVEVNLPVSVMGLNVFEKDSSGNWLCGSFSGMYRWNRYDNTVRDYFTGEVPADQKQLPLGKYAVSGYSEYFDTVAEYYTGTDSIIQPSGMRYLPMSLWNMALEAHSGRLFIGSAATYIFIFMTGLVAIWCIWSGWKVRIRKY